MAVAKNPRKPKVKHVTEVVKVTTYKVPRWYFRCTCGRIGKRNKAVALVERSAFLHCEHKRIAPKPGVRGVVGRGRYLHA